jgi:hypothetical protein
MQELTRTLFSIGGSLLFHIHVHRIHYPTLPKQTDHSTQWWHHKSSSWNVFRCQEYVFKPIWNSINSSFQFLHRILFRGVEILYIKIHENWRLTNSLDFTYGLGTLGALAVDFTIGCIGLLMVKENTHRVRVMRWFYMHCKELTKCK